MLARPRQWLRALVLRHQLERDMQEEMASHLERAAERLRQRGLSEREARGGMSPVYSSGTACG